LLTIAKGAQRHPTDPRREDELPHGYSPQLPCVEAALHCDPFIDGGESPGDDCGKLRKDAIFGLRERPDGFSVGETTEDSVAGEDMGREPQCAVGKTITFNLFGQCLIMLFGFE